MIFENIGYFIKNTTRNNTNTKDYSSLNGDFIFEATFKYIPLNVNQTVESCVLGRGGYPFGIYVTESPTLTSMDSQFSYISNTVKWCWFREENGDIIYDDIFFGIGNTSESYNNHFRWWSEFVTREIPIHLSDDIISGLVNRWGFFDSSFSIDSIESKEVLDWVNEVENNRKKTGSYLNDIVKISVIRTDGMFKMYINDIFYSEKAVGNIVDLSDKTIYIGMDDAYKDSGNIQYFNGEIYKVDIYNDIVKSNHTLYASFDFERKTHFKVFDLSNNGNHMELYHTQTEIHRLNEEFNKYARPAKIV